MAILTGKKEHRLVIDTETTGVNPHTAQFLFAKVLGEVVSTYRFPFEIQNAFVIGHNAKYDLIILTKNNLVKNPIQCNFDTMIAYYLLHIDRSRKLENIVRDVFNITKEDLQQVYNRVTKQDRKSLPDKWWTEIPTETFEKYSEEDVRWTKRVYQYCDQELKDELRAWFFNIEMPLVNILTEMELKGVKIDKDKLINIKEQITERSGILEKHLKHIAGQNDINLNSHKQLQEVLYKTLHLPKFKKTKTGIATDHKTLERLKEHHAFPTLLLEYRELKKLLSTYADSILDGLDANNRIHTTYNQALTATRRFSSDSPNLQNIPVKSTWGKQIKECFIPDSNKVFMIADYDQIELRLLAHFSEDKRLLQAFDNNEDLHQLTADLIGKQLGKEFPRAHGKLLNFSLIYGKTPFGFAQDWNCSQEEAQIIIDAYFKQYPQVYDWIESQKELAIKTNGWLQSLAGLPLYIGDLSTNNKSEREHILRCSVNYPIQASSQDILKQAIVLVQQKCGIIPVLMVHDELVYELPKSNVDLWKHKILTIMETCVKLKIDTNVSYTIGNEWSKE